MKKKINITYREPTRVFTDDGKELHIHHTIDGKKVIMDMTGSPKVVSDV